MNVLQYLCFSFLFAKIVCLKLDKTAAMLQLAEDPLTPADSVHVRAGNKRPADVDDKVIFDLGMNTGVDTENWLKQGYKVVAVEANPVLADSVGKKQIESKALKEGRLKILNIGIENSQASGKALEFWIPELHSDKIESLNSSATPYDNVGGVSAEKIDLVISGAGSFDKHSACRVGGCHPIKVQTMACSDLLKQEGVPHYLKIDIEGRDIGCLKNIMANRCGSSQLPKYVSFENYGLDTFAEYFEQTGNGDWKGLLKMMHKRGYTMWKRARTWQSEYNKHLGQMGADSAFGEDLLDLETDKKWKRTSEFADKLGCDVNCTMTGICTGYCDMHAKLDEAVSDQNCNP